MVWDVSDHLWQQYYGACLTYYQDHGDLDIPAKYTTADGFRLGTWINTIRGVYAGKNINYHLSWEQIKALDELGMLWDKRNDHLWENGYKEALEYRRTYGNLNVPSLFKTKTGYPLGKWIFAQRGNKRLSEQRRTLLNDIGLVWTKQDQWKMRYAMAKSVLRYTWKLEYTR